MLKSLRKHAKYFYFLFFLIILTFVFWGVGMNNNQQSQPLAVIDGHRISLDEFYVAADSMDRVYSDAYGSKYDAKMRSDVHKQVLDTLIQEYVLSLAAAKAGMTVSDDEIRQVIMSDTNFQQNGAFSDRIYRRTLSYNHLTPERYEASVRRKILLSKIRGVIEDSVVMNDDELKNIQGDAKLVENLKETMLKQKKDEAVQSFVNGLMRSMDVTINRDLIPS